MNRGPILGPESGPKTGPLFCPSVAKKCNPGFPETTTTVGKNGHCHAMVSLAIPPHEPTDLDQLLGYNLATASPRPALTICARQGHFCIAYSASRPFRRDCRLQRCSTVKSLSSAPQQWVTVHLPRKTVPYSGPVFGAAFVLIAM